MSILSSALRSPIASTSRSISTSAIVFAAAKKAAKPVAKKRQGSNFNKNKGAKSGSGNRIQAGGLTLRTTLARDPPDLSDLPQLYPESIIPPNLGKPSVFPRNTYNQLEVFGLPRNIEKEFSLGTPATVIRQSTLNLARLLTSLANPSSSSSSPNNRLIITGPRGSGKSTLLIQSVSHALESGWIVLYTPRTTQWIDSSSPYAYHAGSGLFRQPKLASEMLNRLNSVNRDRLKLFQLEKEATLEIGSKVLEAGMDLTEVVGLGAKDGRYSVEILELVMETLGKQTQFPVLFAIDEVQTLFIRSDYRAPDFSTLESYHLSTPRLALDYISGRRKLAKGAILTALSYSDPTRLPPPSLLQPLSIPSQTPVHAYTKLDPYHLSHASSGIGKIEVPAGMTTVEAAGMFELWTRKGWARSATDEAFMGNLVASAGNPLQLARGSHGVERVKIVEFCSALAQGS